MNYVNLFLNKSQKGLPLETKNTQNHENLRLGLTEVHCHHSEFISKYKVSLKTFCKEGCRNLNFIVTKIGYNLDFLLTEYVS